MKGGGRRPEQLGEALRTIIAEALVRDVRDPRVGLVTVTGVQATADLSVARVRVAVPGDEEQKRQALEGLQSAAGFLRTKAARALSTRTVPELRFELDRGLEHAQRIGEILADLRREGELD
jgi:ribosome-binding factor A